MQDTGKRRAACALQLRERCRTVASCCEVASCQAHHSLHVHIPCSRMWRKTMHSSRASMCA